jgi:hypothetical protein
MARIHAFIQGATLVLAMVDSIGRDGGTKLYTVTREYGHPK